LGAVPAKRSNQNDAQHILIVAKAASAQRRGHAARATEVTILNSYERMKIQ